MIRGLKYELQKGSSGLMKSPKIVIEQDFVKIKLCVLRQIEDIGGLHLFKTVDCWMFDNLIHLMLKRNQLLRT